MKVQQPCLEAALRKSAGSEGRNLGFVSPHLKITLANQARLAEKYSLATLLPLLRYLSFKNYKTVAILGL